MAISRQKPNSWKRSQWSWLGTGISDGNVRLKVDLLDIQPNYLKNYFVQRYLVVSLCHVLILVPISLNFNGIFFTKF